MQSHENLSQFLVLLVCVIAVPVHAQTPASVLENLPVPPNTDVLAISEQSLIDGVPAAMATLTSTTSIESVIDFYRDTWQPNEDEDDPGFVESELTGWRIISRLEDGYNIVVQLRDGQSQASGFVSVMQMAQRVQSRNDGPFANLQNLSRHQSTDGRDTSTVSVYASPSSVSETHTLYREKLLFDGWQIMTDMNMQGTFVMVLSRDQSRLEISVAESTDYGSMVVVNEVVSK